MTSTLKKYIAYHLVFLLSSCSSTVLDSSWNEAEISYEKFKEIVEVSHNRILAKDSILAIPGIGCSTCISDAQNYFYESKNNMNLLFIFSDITDVKMFKQEIEPTLWNQENVLVDSTNLLVNAGLELIYPSLLKVVDERVYIKIFEK